MEHAAQRCHREHRGGDAQGNVDAVDDGFDRDRSADAGQRAREGEDDVVAGVTQHRVQHGGEHAGHSCRKQQRSQHGVRAAQPEVHRVGAGQDDHERRRRPRRPGARVHGPVRVRRERASCAPRRASSETPSAAASQTPAPNEPPVDGGAPPALTWAAGGVELPPGDCAGGDAIAAAGVATPVAEPTGSGEAGTERAPALGPGTAERAGADVLTGIGVGGTGGGQTPAGDAGAELSLWPS